MTSLSAESHIDARHLDSAPCIWETDGSPDVARFLQPEAGRIVTGAGLAGGQLQQALRHHSSVARRIVLGRLILSIIGKSSKPL
jgi:hypothetical protein